MSRLARSEEAKMCPPNRDEPAPGGEVAVVPPARDVADQYLGPAGSGARLVIDHAATGFALFSAECRVLYGNHALASLFGYTAGELLTVDPWHLIVLDEGLDPARLLAPGDAGRPGAAPARECRFRRRDGSLFWGALQVVSVAPEPGGPSCFVAQVRETSAEHELRAVQAATQQNLWDVLNRINDGFLAVDRDWRITWVNESAARLTEARGEPIVGRRLLECYPGLRGSTAHAATIRAMDEGVETSYTTYYQPFQRWYAGRVYPAADGLAIYFQDVTELRRAEAAILGRLGEAWRDPLDESAANAPATPHALRNEFVTLLAHELRNPLTTIQGFSELLSGESLPSGDVRHFATLIHENAVRLRQIIGDVLEPERSAESPAGVAAGETTPGP